MITTEKSQREVLVTIILETIALVFLEYMFIFWNVEKEQKLIMSAIITLFISLIIISVIVYIIHSKGKPVEQK